MYAIASKLESLPIISLQTGETVAVTRRPIIDPEKLEVIAVHCEAPRRVEKILMMRDVRQMAIDCFIIDSADELADPADVIRVQALIKAGFTPLGKVVVTDLGRRLGSVDDYTINLETSRVQKLYIKQSILRSLLGSAVIIDRTQIVDITPKQITVRDTHTAVPMLATEPAPETNP